VHSIILAIESPGGEVDGTQAAADVIRSVRGKKPIVTLVDGLAASAGYWLGSAADKVYITGDTAMVGSIGVVMTHTDYSQAEKARGVNVTEITAGKYKRIASEHAPLSQEGRASIQDMVDHIYSVFVDAVAQSRGVSADTVHEKMADGRVFLGKQAIDAGLVDGVSSMDALIADLNQQRTTSVGRASKGALPPKSSPKGEVHVEGQVFVIGGAEIKTQAELDEAVKAACATASTAAATAERERIQAVESQALPGHEALIASLKFDGKSTGGDAAVAVLAAEKKLRGDAVSNLKKDAPKPVATAAPDQQEQPEADAGDGKSGDMIADAKVVAEKAKAYVVEQKAQGNKHITFAEAVAHVSKKEKQ
jgi:signal peptide peptidase SppA